MAQSYKCPRYLLRSPGGLRIFRRGSREEICLAPGEKYALAPGRLRPVINAEGDYGVSPLAGRRIRFCCGSVTLNQHSEGGKYETDNPLAGAVSAKAVFLIPGGGCALHAKMAEACGFECAYMSGALTAAHILGVPDAGLITVTEIVENAGRMANIISLPLISDSDQGFGNAVNVRRTVESFIQAGVAGIHIEDQPFPKHCGFVKGKEIIPLEEAVGKYRAAIEAKRELDSDFVIIARRGARTVVGGGLEETLTRMKAYKQAGVDVVYFEAPQSLEEVKIARQEIEGPLMATLREIKPRPPLEKMQQLGLSAAFYPALAAFGGMIASWDLLQDFQQRGSEAEQELHQRTKGHPLGGLRFFDLVGFPEVREWEEKYLPQEQLSKYKQSQGLYDPTDKATLGRSVR